VRTNSLQAIKEGRKEGGKEGGRHKKHTVVEVPDVVTNKDLKGGHEPSATFYKRHFPGLEAGRGGGREREGECDVTMS